VTTIIGILSGIAALFAGFCAIQPLGPPNPLLSPKMAKAERRAGILMMLASAMLAGFAGWLI